MPRHIALPDGYAPSNLHLRSSVKIRYIEGDVFDICQRLAEVSPALFVVELTEGDRAQWAIMEQCRDGVSRLVKKYDELDARMIADVQRMLRIPLEHRAAAIEAEIDAANEKRREDNLEMLYETLGLPMLRMLERCHFIEQRPTSYPKRGVRPRAAAAV